ncbi:phage tail domain-containing protein [Bacillus sp. GC_Bacil_1]|uniref:phage tail domain-containing protein n=1 Tax=Bacillus sp. GC_Bacil_1 TaxID=2937370 RepID=UPI00226B40F7|nr:phage tail domain-containing protein [Bacillus sp. GC_Bacil_1]
MFDVRINEMLGRDYHLCMVERPNIPTAKEKIELIEVPGRENGSLTKKNGYEDVTFKINFNLLEDENIKPLLRRIKAWILSAKTLSFTDDNVFRKIKKVEIDDINNEIEEYGQFEVTFIADPFEYAILQPMEITATTTLVNYGTKHSLPKITIYGSGSITVTINDVSFLIRNVNSSVVIDSELKEAYSNTTPMNSNMIGNFPTFSEGENTIKWTGTVTSVQIDPRWRYL